MEVSLILDNRLVKNYEFTKRNKRELKTLDDYINIIKNGNTNELSKTEIKALDKCLGTIQLKNKRLYKALIFLVAFLNCSYVVFADVGDACSRLDRLGLMLLTILKKVGFWICLISCFIEILKSFLNSEVKDIWKIFFKYISVFLVLYSLPYAFNLIVGVFEDL